jgi:hypothetical protein
MTLSLSQSDRGIFVFFAMSLMAGFRAGFVKNPLADIRSP